MHTVKGVPNGSSYPAGAMNRGLYGTAGTSSSTAYKDVSQSREAEMNEIYEMSTQGIVKAAMNFRSAVLQTSEFVINESAEYRNTPDMEFARFKYHVPMLNSVDKNYTMFGYCPYEIREVPFKKTNKVARVPVPFPPGTWSLECIIDPETGEESWELYDKRTYTTKPIKYWVKSSLCDGPMWNSGRFDTDCGAILPLYRRHQQIMDRIDAVAEREAHPSILVKKEIPAHTAGADIEVESLTALVQRIKAGEGENLNDVPFQAGTSDEFRILPPHYDTCGHQPRHTSIYSETDSYEQLVTLVSQIFNCPLSMLYSRRGGSLGRANERELSMEKATISNAMFPIASDRAAAMKEIWMSLYNEEVPVYIPIRPLVDQQDITELQLTNSIDPVMATELRLRIFGIHPDHERIYAERGKLAKKKGTKNKNADIPPLLAKGNKAILALTAATDPKHPLTPNRDPKGDEEGENNAPAKTKKKTKKKKESDSDSSSDSSSDSDSDSSSDSESESSSDDEATDRRKKRPKTKSKKSKKKKKKRSKAKRETNASEPNPDAGQLTTILLHDQAGVSNSNAK